jgi:hypothetical protein
MTDIPSLASLDFLPYISPNGQLPEQFQGSVGVYAVFDQNQILQYIGYSRDVYLSLKQHLVRQPQACFWVKVKTIDRPSRAVLESIRDGWIAENGSLPVGNDSDAAKWNQPIDIRVMMSSDEQSRYASAIDELTQTRVLKQVARRVEAEILELLRERGLQDETRFNPKLKEAGLLDLK